MLVSCKFKPYFRALYVLKSLCGTVDKFVDKRWISGEKSLEYQIPNFKCQITNWTFGIWYLSLEITPIGF